MTPITKWRWLWIDDDNTSLAKLIRLLNDRLKKLQAFLENNAGGPGDGLYAAEGFFFNAGNVLLAGESNYLDIPTDFTITNAEIVGDQNGSVSVEVYVSSYGTWNTWTKISGADPLVLSGTKKATSAMVGWTKSFAGGHYVKFVITGTPTSVRKATCTLTLTAPVSVDPGTPPNGPAGGDLQGTYPNPTIIPSVALSGNPTTTTQAAGNNSTRIATTAFVATSFAPLASPALTGTPTAPTAAVGTNTTQVATTAFVLANVSGAGTTFTMWDPDGLPGSSNALDWDVVNGATSFPAGWSILTGGAASGVFSVTYDSVARRAYQQGQNIGGWSSIGFAIPAAGAGDFRFYARVQTPQSQANYSLTGVFLSNALVNNTQMYRAAIGWNGNYKVYIDREDTGVLLSGYDNGMYADWITFAIRRVGVSYYVEWSLDGVVWMTLVSALAPFFTPNYIGLNYFSQNQAWNANVFKFARLDTTSGSMVRHGKSRIIPYT